MTYSHSQEGPEDLEPEQEAQPFLLSRRQILVLGTAATALLSTAYATMRQVGCYPTPATSYTHLTPKEVAVLTLLGDFLLPPGGDLPGSAGDVETLHRIDHFFDGLPPHKRRLVRALPQVFEHGSGLSRFGARSMTRLPSERLADYLDQWAYARVTVKAQLWTALKTVYSLTYFERPDVLAAMSMPTLCGGPER